MFSVKLTRALPKVELSSPASSLTAWEGTAFKKWVPFPSEIAVALILLQGRFDFGAFDRRAVTARDRHLVRKIELLQRASDGHRLR